MAGLVEYSRFDEAYIGLPAAKKDRLAPACSHQVEPLSIQRAAHLYDEIDLVGGFALRHHA